VVYCYLDDLAAWLRRKVGLAAAPKMPDSP
jgi:hypothetical protein